MLKQFIGKITFWKTVFAVLVALGAYATYVRFFRGLGASTNLSDDFPWGLWIGFDVLVGVGLAAGGFVIAATVHILKLEKYEPIARPTILTAFLGYQLVVVALLYDIGHPYRLWHPLVMWNPHSVMFEVAWCVTLYTAVLALEFSPIVFERLEWKKPLRWARAAYLPLVVAGVLLSTLHQSSLGTLYVIAPDKLHGLWYSPLLPIFFFLSAIGVGLAMTIFESFMSYRAFGHRLKSELLQGLARTLVAVLAVYLVWRTQDLASRGALGLALERSTESVLFWGEMGLGAVLPMALFAIPAVRRSEHGLFLGATLTILGFVLNRLNVAVTGMARSSDANYFPSWMEIAVTAMIVGTGFVVFALAVKHLPIFPEEEREESPPGQESAPRARPAFHGGTILGLWIFLIVLVAAVAYSSRNANEPAAEAALSGLPADAPDGETDAADLRLPPPYLFPRGEESPGAVTFRHLTHVVKTGADCGACHRDRFRLTAAGTPIEGELTQERIHSGDLCQACHTDGGTAFSTEECGRCHAE